MRARDRRSEVDVDLPAVTRTTLKHGYLLDKLLGQGGNASVFLVKSLKYDCQFVVKVTKHGGQCEQRDNEIKTLMTITHKNVLCIYEYFQDDTYLYIILEYCPGGSLDDLVRTQGPLPISSLIQMCGQICEAMRAVHSASIAHRDIKPANILLDQYGRPKLADFGLSNFYDEAARVRSRAGSLPYMAPEIIQGSGGHNPFKSDVWALGVTFFYLATGSLPWETACIPDLLKAISIGYVDYGFQSLSKEFIDMLKGMITPDVDARLTIEQILALPMFSDPSAPTPNVRLAMKRGKSRTLAGMKFVSRHRSVGRQDSLTLAASSKMKSSGYLLSFTPSYGGDLTLAGNKRPGESRKMTFL